MTLSRTPWNGEAFAAAIRSTSDHFALAERFLEEWYPPIKPDERIPESELEIAEGRLRQKFPPALRRRFDLVGRRGLILTGNGDSLRMPSELKLSDGVLELILETQGVWRIGLQEEDLHLPDPPVWSYDREKYNMWSRRSPVSPKLSTFMLLWALYSVKYEAPFTAESLEPADISRLIAQFPRLHLENGPLFDQCDFGYHAGEDLLIEVGGLNGNSATWVWISARNEGARNRAVPLVDCDWDLHAF